MAPPKGTKNNPTGIGGPKKGDPSRNPGGYTKEEAAKRAEARAILFSRAESLLNKAVANSLADEPVNNPMLQCLVLQVLGKEPERSEVSFKGDASGLLKGLTADGVNALIPRLEADRGALASREGQGVGVGRAVVSSGPKPESPTRGPMVKS